MLFGSVRSSKCTSIRKNRRQAQSHLEDLEKLQPIKDKNWKPSSISWKELSSQPEFRPRTRSAPHNNPWKDSGPSTYTILPMAGRRERNKYRDSLKTSKDCISKEAAYQIQAAEIKKETSLEDRNKTPRDGKHNFRRRSRSYFGDKSGRGNQKCSLCAASHPLMKCDAFNKQSVDGRW